MVMQIRPWVEAKFSDGKPRTMIEIGGHLGEDTAWLAAIPGVTLHVFEPDPRLPPPPDLPENVAWNQAAVSKRDGTAKLILSADRRGTPHTASSSLKTPTGHLTQMPDITFGDQVDVPVVTLDSYVARAGIGAIDFIWCDAQGSEPDIIRGGQAAFRRVHWFYAECPKEAQYAGQLDADGLLALLPGRWMIRERYPDDVLFMRLR